MSKEEVMNFLKEREKELVEGIDLFDGVKIRRISKEDLEDLKTPFLSTLHPFKELAPHMFVLEKYITVEDEHAFQADTIMRNVVLALRLLKRGYVSGSYVFYILISKKRQLKSWSWEKEPRRPSGIMYALNFDEIPGLKKIVEKIQGIYFTKRKRLILACKRFQRAYEEADFEDQLIDLMIAFEALFSRKEIEGANPREKIANGCSDLLGKNNEEKEEIRRFLLKARSVRDLIVHGSEYKIEGIVKEYDMFSFVWKLEGYLRESIKKLLD